MTDYVGRQLLFLNPCGVENSPETHCKYVKECAALGRDSGALICVSKMGYQVAGFLLECSSVEIERRDLDSHLRVNLNLPLVDPKKDEWKSSPLASSNLDSIVNEMIVRGENFSRRAYIDGNAQDPLNFDCSPAAIVADLF